MRKSEQSPARVTERIRERRPSRHPLPKFDFSSDETPSPRGLERQRCLTMDGLVDRGFRILIERLSFSFF